MSGTTYTNIFGNTAVKPSQPSYAALTISVNTPLLWPLETTEGVPYVADEIDVTATVGGLQLQMPAANTGSTGVATLINNVGANTFTVTDTAGNAITTVATTQSWIITLSNNATANGTWRATQLGATTSSATAGALAGAGLQASGSLLQVQWIPRALNTNTTLTSSFRANAIRWTGPTGTLQLDTSVNLTAGWYCAVCNIGSGTVTVTTTGGQLIDNVSNFPFPVGSPGGIIICDGTNFEVYGAHLSPVQIVDGGTGATTAGQALTNLGGTTIGTAIFTAPSASAVVALLGLSSAGFNESTISTNQVLNAGSTATAFICTAVLTLTLPLTSTVTKQYYFAVYAQNGAVTVTPQSTDAINGGSAGSNFTLQAGGSAMFTTDAAGNWWPVFLALPLTGGNITGNLAINGNLLQSLMRGYIGGLTLANDATTPATVLDVVAGSCVDSTNSVFISLPAGITKSVAGPWVAGAGQPGMGQGLTATPSVWYHVFAIVNSGFADVYFDTSVSAANAPTGTTAFRRIGSIFYNGAPEIEPFIQIDETFYYRTSAVSVSGDATLSNVPKLYLVSTPPNVRTKAILSVSYVNNLPATSGESALVYEPDITTPVQPYNIVQPVTAQRVLGYFEIYTNAASPSGQIAMIASSAGSNVVSIVTLGWLDTRGRFI